MSHEKDREHPRDHPPREVPRPRSTPQPDRKYSEHTTEPREPVDPRLHPR